MIPVQKSVRRMDVHLLSYWVGELAAQTDTHLNTVHHNMPYTIRQSRKYNHCSGRCGADNDYRANRNVFPVGRFL